MASIRERTPGVWEITVSTGQRDPITGRYGKVSRTVRTAPSRQEAKRYPRVVEAAAAALANKVNEGRLEKGRHTLGQLLDEYLRHQKSRGRAPKTLLEDARRADVIKADLIGAKDLRRLTGFDLDQFDLRLASSGGRSGKGRHVTTRHHYHALIRAALNQAINWQWMPPPNPASAAEAPPLAPDERVPPTPAEARMLAIEAVTKHPDLASLVWVDTTTGMRRGELCGLRICDIDFQASEAVVWWRASDIPATQRANVAEEDKNIVKLFPNGVAMLAATKNKKRRRFALDPFTIAVLTEQIGRAKGRCEALDVDLAPDALIWSQEADHSQPWKPDRVTDAFTTLRKRLKLDNITLNDLRHFNATQLVGAGFDPKMIAQRIGHDPSVLLRIYTAALPARDKAAASFLGELMSGEAS